MRGLRRVAGGGGREVVIVLAVRRFRCAEAGCPKVTFTEQVTGLSSRYSRRTPPLARMPGAAAAALCGRPGARPARTRPAAAAGIARPGRAAMLRLFMAAPVPEPGTAPRVLGGVRLIFQPAEETANGAQGLIAAGALDASVNVSATRAHGSTATIRVTLGRLPGN
jgi:hypothetical protein